MRGPGERPVRGRWTPLTVGALLVACPLAVQAQQEEAGPPDCGPEIAATASGERYIPYDVVPRLLNPERVQQALDSIYRIRHPDRELGADAAVWVRVDCRGRARATRWVDPPGDHRRELLDLVRDALELARFEPARNRGEPVTVFIQHAVDLPPTDTSSSRREGSDGWAGSPSPTVPVSSGEVDLAVWELGAGPHTTVVLHGGPGVSHDYLRPEWDRLAEGGRVIYYDQRGCGRSGGGPEVGWRTHVEDLRQVIRSRAGGGPVVLAGSSWGAELAVLYALKHPEDVRGLVLSGYVTIEPSQVGQEREVVRVSGALADSLTAAGLPDSLVRALAGDSLPVITGRIVRRDLGEEGMGDPPVSEHGSGEPEGRKAGQAHLDGDLAARLIHQCSRTGRSTLRSLDDRPPLEALQSLEIPALLIRGASVGSLRDGTDELADVLPRARILAVPDPGHDPWHRHPEEVFPAIREFIASLPDVPVSRSRTSRRR